MSGTVTHIITLETTTCAACGVVFGIPDYLIKKKKETGEDFYCPNGHSLVFGNSENKRLREALQKEKSARESAEAQSQEWFTKFEKERKEKSRIQKRVHAGVCTCCNRHFVDLERHMKSKPSEHISTTKACK